LVTAAFLLYKLYFAMTAANNKTHTVKGKKEKEKKHTTYNSEHKKLF